MGLDGIVPAGVVTGDNLIKLMNYCRDNRHALPAFNCTSTSTINAILQAARDINSPVIIQVLKEILSNPNRVLKLFFDSFPMVEQLSWQERASKTQERKRQF